MKKKVFIVGSVLLVVILCISLFLIFGRNEEDKVVLKDYSYVNVESLKTSEVNTLDVNDFVIKDGRINEGYLEGILFNNSDDSFDLLEVVIYLYDEEGNVLDKINFEFKDVASYEERDLFYPIQKDLSKAYYISVEER